MTRTASLPACSVKGRQSAWIPVGSRGACKTLAALCLVSLLLIVPPRVRAEAENSSTGASPAAEPKPAAPPPKETPPPAELVPYRVRISLLFRDEPRWNAAFRTSVADELQNLAARTVGQMWSLDVRENEWISRRDISGIERTTADEVLAHEGQNNFDKVFLVAVEADGSRLRVGAREWDETSRELGPLATTETWQRAEIADQAYSLIRSLFHPVLEIGRAVEDSVQLTLRAGAYPALDPKSDQVRVGDYLAPVYRYFDRDQNLRNVAYLPRTYLLVESVQQGRVMCRSISWMRNPFGGRPRRVGRFAIRLNREFDHTELKLVLSSNPSKALVGHRVDLLLKTFPKDKPEGEPIALVSDRNGIVRIPVVEGHPLVWVQVHSGNAFLAKAPLVPGTQPTETYKLADDSMRLAAESDLALLKSRVVDAVAKRISHVIRARALAEDNKWDEVDAELAKLQKVPGIAEFKQQLNAIRVPALEAADRAKNKYARKAIEKLCNETTDLIDRHLSEAALSEPLEEIKALKKAK